MLDRRVESVRGFNRFYTFKIGILRNGYLNSPFSLAEVRVLYELAHRDAPTATELGRELGIDPGYLSRILARFEKGGFISRKPSQSDKRQVRLTLKKKGKDAIGALEASSQQEIGALLGKLPDVDQERVVEAMRTIETLLGNGMEPKAPYVLRPHQPGDIGWIVHRHGVLYAKEYGWDEHFEALVAEVAAGFIQKFDAKKERCWIAERDGRILGCVFLVRATDELAKLRLLLVEPEARGLGLGTRLVDECIRFARQVGYKKMTLWTNDVLHAARRIYERAGFQLVKESRGHDFGHDHVFQDWDLVL
ncbi:MAG TPA: bifunctional helix-turn-helix transcriptional regulator/GNAT family N-acetyltransferase [Bryobacteraceae bacterium]|nr:bifunctional helix-turn-helix transcriptional regulator/GNAT family N-acetyltransferase [Bryobacteraceae bacterium]